MTRARDIADLAGAADAGTVAGTNLIINGDMAVAQRGTSVTGATSSGYETVDRFSYNASGGTLSMSQQTLTVGQTDIPSQFKYFFRVNATTGNNNAGVRTRIENVDSVQGTVTLSFYAKGTNPNGGNFELQYEQNFGSGGSSYVRATDTFSVTSSWQRFTKTISVGSISGKTIGTSSYYEVYFKQPDADTSTNAWTLDITGVKLEVGSTATPFLHESFGDNLAKCQRYFCKTYQYGTAIGTGTSDNALHNSIDATQSYAQTAMFTYPVTMRTTPTITSYNTNNGASGQLSGDSSNYTATITALGDGRCTIRANNTSIGTSTFVKAHATASAEL